MSLGIRTCLDTHLSECFLRQLGKVAVVGTGHPLLFWFWTQWNPMLDGLVQLLQLEVAPFTCEKNTTGVKTTCRFHFFMEDFWHANVDNGITCIKLSIHGVILARPGLRKCAMGCLHWGCMSTVEAGAISEDGIQKSTCFVQECIIWIFNTGDAELEEACNRKIRLLRIVSEFLLDMRGYKLTAKVKPLWWSLTFRVDFFVLSDSKLSTSTMSFQWMCQINFT